MAKIQYDDQSEYASIWTKMYDRPSRELRAKRIITTIGHFFGKNKIKKLSVLDVGASTGIIDNTLSKAFKHVTGIDVDKEAIAFAKKTFRRKNLTFKVGDAMKVPFGNNMFDVVICTHVYEHVPNDKVLFAHIFRVLKPGGICYLAAINSLWPIEPHYKLPFLSWLPKNLSNVYLKLLNKADRYYETPRTYWSLRKLTSKFIHHDYTTKIYNNPELFGYEDTIPNNIIVRTAAKLLLPLEKYFSPTFFWILEKP